MGYIGSIVDAQRYRPDRLHMSKEYANIAYLVGSRLKILHGIELAAKPSAVWFMEDYPETILINMEFTKSIWSSDNQKPRYVKRMIPKSALACGDVKLSIEETGEILYGVAIAPKMMTTAECVIL